MSHLDPLSNRDVAMRAGSEILRRLSARAIDRRGFCGALLAGAVAACAPRARADERQPFRLRYVLASSLYGKTDLAEILPEVRKVGAEHIDVWPLRHGNQREQIEAMGHQAFADLLERHRVELGVLTRYDLGPFELHSEMKFAHRFGGTLIIAGSGGPANLTGQELKSQLRSFGEKIRPHAEAAAELGITLGIENHAGSLLSSPDSIRWFAELVPSPNVGVALAPYHLPQDTKLLAGLIEGLGPRLALFYAWQHGMGCMTKLPKEQELLQMPGRGSLDFAPLVAALKKIDYSGWTAIFMHPVPRGIPILESTAAVTAEINRARRYLEA